MSRNTVIVIVIVIVAFAVFVMLMVIFYFVRIPRNGKGKLITYAVILAGPGRGHDRALHSPGTGSIEMLDHVTIGVSDIERSKAFYDQALRPLGIERLYAEGGNFAGYGADRKAFFWIGRKDVSQTGVHIAFTARDRETVDRFHKAALAAGGKDNGQPGLRPHYHENYYGAFILDPDGHNIEAVCHQKIG